MTGPSPARPPTGEAGSNLLADGGPRRVDASGRQRRDLVTWVALGLLVVVVLAIVTKATTTPDPPRSEGSPSHEPPPRRADKAHDDPGTDDAKTDGGGSEGLADKPPPASRSSVIDPTTTQAPTATAPDLRATTTTQPNQTTVRPTPTTVPAAPGQFRYSGTLAFPDDVATSIPFSSASGLAAVRVSWSGGDELVASLRCRGADDSAPGSHGISISIDGAPGGCDVAISLGPGVRARVPYVITVLTTAESR